LTMPISSESAMAGLSSDQKLAAIMIPAVNPSEASSARRLTSLKKKTTAAPTAVSPQVKIPAASACQAGGHDAKVSNIDRHRIPSQHTWSREGCGGDSLEGALGLPSKEPWDFSPRDARASIV